MVISRALIAGMSPMYSSGQGSACFQRYAVTSRLRLPSGLKAGWLASLQVMAIVRNTREQTEYESGLSPRAALSLLRSAQAWAMLHHRDAVLPEDLQAVLPSVVGHRLRSRQDSGGADPERIARQLLESVPIP